MKQNTSNTEPLISMIDSCFTYGGADKENYNYKRYIEPYKDKIGEELFNKTYNERLQYLSKCTVKHNVHTDFEGCSYNSLIHP